MKPITIILAALLLAAAAVAAQPAGKTNWLSFVIQAESRPGGSASWERGQRLEVSKNAGVQTPKEQAAGLIRFKPEDKEVQFTFSNFTLDGAWFSPSEIAVEYQEDGRVIGPVRALPGAGASDYFQLSLRFREKTERSVLTIWAVGRASGQFVRDTIRTVLMWGSGGEVEAANVQVAYLDTYGSAATTAKSPYVSTPSNYGASQGRIDPVTGVYAIQLGAYATIPDSRQFTAAAAYGEVYSRRLGGLYQVRVGSYNELGLAQQYLQRIRSSFPEAYLVVEDKAAPSSATTAYQQPYYQQPAQYGTDASRITGAGTVAARGAAASAYDLPAGTAGYALQLASYAEEGNAINFADGLKQRGLSDVYVWKKDGKNRVVVGPFSDKGGAANYLATLKRQYLLDGIVVNLKN